MQGHLTREIRTKVGRIPGWQIKDRIPSLWHSGFTFSLTIKCTAWNPHSKDYGQTRYLVGFSFIHSINLFLSDYCVSSSVLGSRNKARNIQVKKKSPGTSLVVQWLRFYTPNAGALSLTPGQGTRSRAATKTQQPNLKRESCMFNKKTPAICYKRKKENSYPHGAYVVCVCWEQESWGGEGLFLAEWVYSEACSPLYPGSCCLLSLPWWEIPPSLSSLPTESH